MKLLGKSPVPNMMHAQILQAQSKVVICML